MPMDIVRSIIAALFVLMAFGIASRYATVRRLGLLFGALTYGAAGVLAIVLGAWWPLLFGFAGAWMLRGVGADPPTDLRLDLPTIERADVSDPARVREYLNWWVAHDSQVRLVASQFICETWKRGLRRPDSVPIDGSWAAPTAYDCWFRKTAEDMQALATAPMAVFMSHLDGIDALGSQTLVTAGEITMRYDLPPAPRDFASVSGKIRSEAELTAYAENYVADAVLSARLRVLARIYQYWHGERYELPEKRRPA